MARNPKQPHQVAGVKNSKKGVRLPRHWKTGESYRFVINEAIEAMARGDIGRDTAYTLRDLANAGMAALLSYGMQKNSDGGVVVVADEDIAEASDETFPPEIEGECTQVDDDVPNTAETAPEISQTLVSSKVIALLQPRRAANDTKPRDDAEDDGD